GAPADIRAGQAAVVRFLESANLVPVFEVAGVDVRHAILDGNVVVRDGYAPDLEQRRAGRDLQVAGDLRVGNDRAQPLACPYHGNPVRLLVEVVDRRWAAAELLFRQRREPRYRERDVVDDRRTSGEPQQIADAKARITGRELERLRRHPIGFSAIEGEEPDVGILL